MKIRTSISLDKDVLDKVEHARGSYSRSGFINEFLRKGLIKNASKEAGK